MSKPFRPQCEDCLKECRETALTRLFRYWQANDVCDDCARAYFGRYDPENPALRGVLESIRDRRKLRWKSARTWDEKQALTRLYGAYGNRVRSLSRRTLEKQADVLNPKKRKIGRAGQPHTYQLDHIVPVVLCWEHYVAPEDAAHPANLQVISWGINLARSSHVNLDLLVGWPYAPLHLWHEKLDCAALPVPGYDHAPLLQPAAVETPQSP